MKGAASFAMTFAVVVGVSITVMHLDLMVRSRVRQSRPGQALSTPKATVSPLPTATGLDKATA